jgi:hypothetical protein
VFQLEYFMPKAPGAVSTQGVARPGPTGSRLRLRLQATDDHAESLEGSPRPAPPEANPPNLFNHEPAPAEPRTSNLEPTLSPSEPAHASRGPVALLAAVLCSGACARLPPSCFSQRMGSGPTVWTPPCSRGRRSAEHRQRPRRGAHRWR